MKDLEFNQLICQIYESVEDISRLIPVMQTIEQKIGARSSHHISYQNCDQALLSILASKPYFEQTNLDYNNYFHEIDPNWDFYISAQQGEWRTDCQLHSKEFTTHSEFYNDFIYKHGFEHTLVSKINTSCDNSELLVFLQPRGAEFFATERLQLLQRLTPHLMQSAKLRQQLHNLNQQNLYQSDIIEHFPYGALWVNEQGKIISANAVAQQQLAEGDGILVKDGKITATDSYDITHLNHAIFRATHASMRQGQWLALQRKKQATKLLLSIIPTAAAAAPINTPDSFIALVIIYDASRASMPTNQLLKQLFQLTPRESDLAAAMLNNLTIEEYAQQQQVSHNTVKTHLANLLQKTGTKRQSELMRKLLLSHPHLQEQSEQN